MPWIKSPLNSFKNSLLLKKKNQTNQDNEVIEGQKVIS